MIPSQRKQLFNPQLSLLALLLILLAFFVHYAIQFNRQFFVVMTFFQAMFLCFLLLLRHRREKERMAIQLQYEEYHERKNLLAGEISKEHLAYKSLFQRLEAYARLKSLAEKLSLCESYTQVGQTLTEVLGSLFGAPQATALLYVLDPQAGCLHLFWAAQNDHKASILTKNGDSFDQWVVKNLKPLLIENAKTDFRFSNESCEAYRDGREVRSVIVTPLIAGSKMLGVLRVDAREESCFSIDDLRFLSRIADLGAVALENAQLQGYLQELAVKDSLTGLYLRRYLLDRMMEELPRQLRRKQEMSLIMMDLDHFKKYNDVFGHVAGDMVLKVLAELLVKYFQKPGHIICRFGGEEFAVLLPDYTKREASELADKFRSELAQTEIMLRREKTCVTISIGIASFPCDAQIKEELIQKADQALYQAKQLGRNRVCWI